jgi:hypothetical protein
MMKMVAKSPSLFKEPMPVLRRRQVGTVALTQEQACCIVIMGMLKLFPYHGGRRIGGLRPSINFGSLVCVTQGSPANIVLMISIMHYVLRMARNPTSPGRNVFVSRRSINPDEHTIDWWMNCDAPLTEVKILPGRIEDDKEAIFQAGMCPR